MSRLVSILAAALSAVTLAWAGQEPGLRARYTKQEVAIPMRDGVTLFTSVYAPVDTSRKVPILMQRTPYGVAPYGPDAYRRRTDGAIERRRRLRPLKPSPTRKRCMHW